MDQLGNRPLEIKFSLSILSLERRTTIRLNIIMAGEDSPPWPVQHNNLSAVLNGAHLERNANVTNSKKSGMSRQHLRP